MGTGQGSVPSGAPAPHVSEGIPSSLSTLKCRLWSPRGTDAAPKRVCLPGPRACRPSHCWVQPGSEGGTEFQGRVLEGLHPASLIRDSTVGQTPLFIELSLLQGVCGCVSVCGGVCVCLMVGSQEVAVGVGGVVSAKGTPVGGPRGYHRPTRECARLRTEDRRSCLYGSLQFVKHFQAVLALRSHRGGHCRQDSGFREKDVRFRGLAEVVPQVPGRRGP